MFDIIIKNGTIVDGSGGKRYVGDIAITDGKIAKIANEITENADRILHAEGLIVSPGFIDYHSHSDNSVLLGSDGYNFLEQGTTTEITGHCGSGPVPYYEGKLDEEKKAICATPESFMQHLSTKKLGTNMAFYLAHGNIRGKVMGFSPELPNKEQLEQMRAITKQAMENGFLGFSTGLVYAPSVYAGTEELIEIAKVVGEYGGNYTSHIRGEGNQLLESIEEAIEIGEKADIPVVISHLKVIGKENQGKSTQAIAILEAANARGVKVRADQYPFIAGSAPLIAQIPPRFITEGNVQLIENIKNPEIRKEIHTAIFTEYDLFESNIYSAGFAGCLIVSADNTPDLVGKTITEIAKEQNKEEIDVLCDILIANDGNAQGIYFGQNDFDMRNIIAHPYVMAGSDWSAYPQHYDTEKIAGGHPRGIATMTRRLEILRDFGLLSLEQAIYSCTGLPAEMSCIDDIGILKEGYHADICIFDYAGIKSNCDYLKPFRKNSGIHYVLVNGAVVVEDGNFNGVKNGTILKKRK